MNPPLKIKVPTNSQREFLSDLLAREAENMEAALAILYREWPHAPQCDLGVLWANQEYIRSVLNPPTAIDAGLRSADGRSVTIEAGNLQGLAVEVTGLALPGRQERIAPLAATVVDGKRRGQVVEYKTVEFSLPEDIVWSHTVALATSLAYRIAGTNAERLVPLTPFCVSGSRDIHHPILQQSPNIHRFDFAAVDQQKRRITIKPGNWSVRQSIVVPAGYTFAITSGTTIDLCERALLLSYSPLDWQGSSKEPITITTSDGTGQGVVVLEAKDASKLSHVRFEELRYPDEDGWSLTGSVTFYESPLNPLFPQAPPAHEPTPENQSSYQF